MENHIDNSQEVHSALKEIGSLLYQERVKKGYRLEDISIYLKISIHTLQAIEEGTIDSLPHLVYTKGFIRSYAQFLDIPEYELTSIFYRIEHTEKTNDEGEDYPFKKKKFFSPYVWGSILTFLCILAGSWLFYSSDITFSSFDVIAQITDSGKKEVLPNQKKEENQSEGSLSLSQQQSQENIKSNSSVVVTKIPENFQDHIVIKKELELSFKEDSSSQLSAQLDEKSFSQSTDMTNKSDKSDVSDKSVVEPVHMNKPGKKNIVVLKGLEDCWVHSTADKTETRQFYVQQGQLFALSFSESLVLKLGNAGGIELKYNGEKLPPVGRSGQVKTITLPLVSQN